MTRALLATLLLALASCSPGEPDRVRADRFDSFWLWAGVSPPAALARAKSVYVLDGEFGGKPVRWKPLRPGIPHSHGPEVWLVVRTDTMDWPPDSMEELRHRADAWADQGIRLAGVQIDFDARTKHLGDYVAFLERVRHSLPARYRLSITGLMDWSANGDPRQLARLKGIVDEVVIQTYQGRSTIWGYERYFERMRSFPIPFKVGLIENGRWVEPKSLRSEPNFRGYVVFLLPSRS